MRSSFTMTLLATGFLACTNGDVDPSDDTDTDTDIDAPIPAEQVTDWCDAAAGGLGGDRDFYQDFARVHVGHRIFGPEADWRQADNNLTFLLASDDGFGPEQLESYASFFPDVCHGPAQAPTARNTVVTENGDTAIVQPGTDAPTLSESVTRVIIDLREVGPDHNISGAIAAAVVGDITLGSARERQFMGFPSQEEGWTHYESKQKTRNLVLEGTSTVERDLVFWTGQRLTPEAAKWVGGLRLDNRAAIVGYDVHTAVAESTWSGLEDNGLTWRSALFSNSDGPWPDVIPADISTITPEYYTDEDVSLGDIPDTAERNTMATYQRDAGEPTSETNKAALSAALLVAYGTIDWFYPYFEIVGRDVDAALLTELDAVAAMDSVTRTDMKHSIGRLMHGIHDGHGYVYDWDGDWPDGYLAIQLQRVNDEPVVRVSNHEGVNAGDTIVAIDGVDAADWYAEATSRYSATSPGYHFVMASDELKEVYGKRTLRLRDPAGVEREEVLSGKSWSALDSVPWGGTFRDNGWLDELGASNLYYVNLSGSVTTDERVITNQWDTVSLADGIILDMRDYPDLDIYGFAGYFQTGGYTAPWFDHPTWTGPSEFEFTREIWSFSPPSNPYNGPVVLLVSNYAVSAAECFAQMLVGLDHVTVMGQQSASTNGTITNLWLPGYFQIYFTGMRLLNLDGSNFHGEGIQPDVVITPTPAELAAGQDPELNAAIDFLLD